MKTTAALLWICALPLIYAADLDSVLSKMDAAAPKFQSMTADVTRVSYTQVLDDKSSEFGTMSLRRQGKEIQVLLDIAKPNAQTVAFAGRKVEKFFPKLNTVQEFDISKYKGMLDQFLMVGFGTSGKDLRANYDLKYAGEETINGQQAHKLQLIPKSPKVRDNFKQLVLWINDDGSYPVQQQFIQPSGDYNLATYSNVKLNPGLTQDDLKLKLPKGVKREYPQK